MAQQGSLSGKVALVAGASRGIGADIARYLAAAGAKVGVAARTEVQSDPRLPGTIHSVTEDIIGRGGEATPVLMNLRDPDSIAAAVAKVVEVTASSTSWSTTRPSSCPARWSRSSRGTSS